MRPQAIACALCALSLSACSPIEVQGKFTLEGPLTTTEGTYISDRTYELLDVGAEQAWAVALFGEPDHRTTLSDGAEIWRWTFRHIGLDPTLLSFGGGDEKDSEDGLDTGASNVSIRTTFVLIREGRIADKWRG